jgi:hypothetical protein
VQLTLDNVQVQPAPAIAVAVSAAGNVSLSVTWPVVAPCPVFVTVSVYCAPVCPVENVPVCVFVRLKSGATIDVTSLAVLFAVLVSPPPETVAALVTLEEAALLTLTVNVTSG